MAIKQLPSRASFLHFTRISQPRRTPSAKFNQRRHNSTSTSTPPSPSKDTARDTTINPLLTTSPPAPQHLPEVPLRAPPKPRPRGSDRQLYLVTLALLLVTPPIVYFYYEHRKAHMGKKKEELIKSLEQKRQAWIAQNR